MDTIRTPAIFVCGLFALVVAARTLAGGRLRRVHVCFCAFAANIGLWYLFKCFALALHNHTGEGVFRRLAALSAVAVPVIALVLFREMTPNEKADQDKLLGVTCVLAVAMLPVAWSCPASQPGLAILFVYVFALLWLGIRHLDKRGQRIRSLTTRARVRTFALLTFATSLFTALDIMEFESWTGLHPSLRFLASALSIVTLFALAETVRAERLLDMSEIAGRLAVTVGLCVVVTVLTLVVVELARTFGVEGAAYSMGLVALAITFVADPLRARVETLLRTIFRRERFDPKLRDRLAHVLDVDEMGTIVMDALSRSHRVTTAGLYLRDPDGAFFEAVTTLGARAPRRVEAATARALLERLDREPVVIQDLEQDVKGRRERRDTRDRDAEAALEASRVFGDLRRGMVVGVHDEQRALIGLLAVSDEEGRDSLAPDDVADLVEIAEQMRVVVENSRVYDQMKARDRLTVVGQMAVGLAHEIKNPLGSIKGAAQLLARPVPGGRADPARLLDIIINEVDRLDGVVTSVLDLAPSRATIAPIDANAVARRTLGVLSAEPGNEAIDVRENLDPAIPRVEIDAGQLEQVLMNLLRNAAQAMHGKGAITVTSRLRVGRGTRTGEAASSEPFVEVSIADNGPGLSRKMIDKLFTPFFTTKEKGIGLGLAISRTIVQAAGGRIDVRSYEGKGTAFSVLLPASAKGTPTPLPITNDTQTEAA